MIRRGVEGVDRSRRSGAESVNSDKSHVVKGTDRKSFFLHEKEGVGLTLTRPKLRDNNNHEVCKLRAGMAARQVSYQQTARDCI